MPEDKCWAKFNLAWLICATLHDTAYPCEILPYAMQKCNGISEIAKELGADMDDISAKPVKNVKLKTKQLNFYELPLTRLYDGSDELIKKKKRLLALIDENVAYQDEKGVKCCNHGVFSSLLFQKLIRDLANDDLTNDPILRWASTAVALHAMKITIKNLIKKGESEFDYKISISQDPLSFMLILCDEMQVWNRNRPYEEPSEVNPKDVNLINIEVENDTEITASVEYVAFDSYARNSASMNILYSKIDSQISKDDNLIGMIISANPIKIRIQNSLRDYEKPLTPIIIK